MGGMELDYAVPAADLSPFVTLFYRFCADVPHFEDVERADHAQFRFRISGGASDYVFGDGLRHAAPPVHIIGATSSATRTRADGPVCVFGMGLTPAGWAALLGIDASSVINRVLDAGALFGAGVAAAERALRSATTIAEMVAIVEPLLRTLIDGDTGPALRFVQAADAWLAAEPGRTIDDLALATGLSRRQVERRCNHLYGAPPKRLARKYRALRAAVALARDGAAANPAMLEGFYDQSHMIREIKHFTGMTPRRIRNDPGLLASLTIERRRALGGRVGPLISDT